MGLFRGRKTAAGFRIVVVVAICTTEGRNTNGKLWLGGAAATFSMTRL
jgi:hypothetical protein